MCFLTESLTHEILKSLPYFEKETGKSLIPFEEYCGLFSPINANYDCIVGQCGCITTRQEDAVFVLGKDPKEFVLMPGAELSPYLYRGENNHYPTCLAGIDRVRDSFDRLERILKSRMFWKSLHKSHPVVQALLSWNIDGRRFKFEPESLSQHYGFYTMQIDATRSKDVALFFAVARFDKKTQRWLPSKGKGYLYTLDIRQLIQKGNHLRVRPLGFQPLQRAIRQKAFSFEASEKAIDYREVFCEKPEIIDIPLQIKIEIITKMEKRLFPEEPEARFARGIQASKVIDKEVFDIFCDSCNFNQKTVQRRFETMGFKFEPYTGGFSKNEQRQITDLFVNSNWMDRLKIRRRAEPHSCPK